MVEDRRDERSPYLRVSRAFEKVERYVRINITRFLSVTYLTLSAHVQAHERSKHTFELHRMRMSANIVCRLV